MKWTSRELTILVNVVSNSSPTEYAHNSPNVPTSELALVVLPSEMDGNKYGMVGEPFTDANEVIIPSGTATNDEEKGGPSGTPITNIEVSCPRSYPEGPPPSEDGYPDVQPGQFAEEDDEPIGINMEGQYNHIFLMELEPVPNGPTPQTDEEDRVGPGDTINEADEQGDVGIPDIPYFCHDKENPTIQKKSTFSDKVTFVLALRQNAIKEEYDFHIEHSDGDRFRARCTNIECKWRIHASRLKPEKTFMVKKLPEMHTCGSANKKTGGKMATKAWVAERSLDILRKEPTMGAKILYDKLEEKYNIKLDYHMVWKGRCVALAELQGTYEQSFQALWNFKAEIESKCPGSVVEIDVEHEDAEHDNADEDAAASAEHSMFFKRLFVAFKPCIDGFLTGCRPYLSVDSTHLTGRYTGQLASANAVDGHTWMFPVAFGIFDKEIEDNWDWFLRQLQNCIGNPPRLVIHSDANKGLEKAIPKVFNVGVEHRECFRHLLSNFKKKFRGTILCHMWPAAWAYRTDKFQQYMEKVATERSDAIQYLEENHKHLWSRCMFSTMSKVEYVNNNLAECFNSWIRHIKEYPLVELVDTLRQMIMVKLFERRKIADKLIGVILPQVIKELNKKSKGLRYTLYCGSLTAAEVTGMSKDNKPWRFVVDLMGGSCTCGQWQLTGKPCTHALALIFSNPELRLENMVDGYYSIESFKAAYSGVLTPIGDKCDWLQVDPGFVMLPPLLGKSAAAEPPDLTSAASRRAPGERKPGRVAGGDWPAATMDRAELTTEQVLKREIPWEHYMSTKLISGTCLQLLRRYDHKPESQRASLLDEDGPAYVRVFLNILQSISKEETVEYVLALIDDMLATNPKRAGLFYDKSLSGEDIYEPFLRLLWKGNWFVQEKSCKILTQIISARPKLQNGMLPNGEASNSKSKLTSTQDVLRGLVDWLCSQLGSPTHPNCSVPTAIHCLSTLLKEPYVRTLFVQVDGVKLLIPLISPASTQQSIQLLYETCLCIWLLSFYDAAVDYLSTTRVMPRLIEVVKGSTKEKVVRVVVMSLRNLLAKGAFAAQMIDLGLPQIVHNLKAQAWTDEDLLEALNQLEAGLKDSLKKLSSFEKYKQQVLLGHLDWSPMHKDPSFWRENINNFEENDFQILRVLMTVIDTSMDTTALAVACYDLSQFLQYHPSGRIVVADLKAKDRVMKLMNHDNAEVRKNALLCVQRLFLGAKYASFLQA